MAQLVKLSNYISRYENDLTRYSTQFIRLKKHHWDRLKYRWEIGDSPNVFDDERISTTEHEEIEQNKWMSFFNKFKMKKELEKNDAIEIEENGEEEDFDFIPEVVHFPHSIESLKKLYMDQLFHFQMKWASSTALESSKIQPAYLRDSLLRELVQKLPDQYFVMYHPVLYLQKAPVALDIILVTPVECILVTVIEEENLAAFSEDTQRFWLKRVGERQEKVLNPMIALNRMTKIISQLLANEEIDIPIRKCLVSRNGYIDYPYGGQGLEVVDRRNYVAWFNALKTIQTPFKYNQFRTVQTLLNRMETDSIQRQFLSEEEEL